MGCCTLEVDVNGQETFLVDRKIMSYFSGRFSKLFRETWVSTPGKAKVIFHDFPGGPDGFELMARFCYNGGEFTATPHNVVLLNRVAAFMGMDGRLSGKPNLTQQTESSLKGISYWTWSELVYALKQCQDLFPAEDSSFLLNRIVDCLTDRLALPTAASSCTCSWDSSFCARSSNAGSVDFSTKSNSSRTNWWFDDLMFLEVGWIDKIVRIILSKKFDQATICKFLLSYQKSRFPRVTIKEKRKMAETVIDLLSLLDRNSNTLPCRCLFYLLRACSSLDIGKTHMTKLESLIGAQLDRATVDHLLIRAPRGVNYAYDVDLILRTVEAFLREGGDCCQALSSQLKRISLLVDSYIEEVAPDLQLEPAKFRRLLAVLPEAARQCYDTICRAVQIYIKVHRQLSQEEILRICNVLNYNKISVGTLEHLASNSEFPSQLTVKALMTLQHKLKLKNTMAMDTDGDEHMNKCTDGDVKPGIVALRVRGYLWRTQWRMMEMEGVYRSMKPGLSSQYNAGLLPKFCSGL